MTVSSYVMLKFKNIRQYTGKVTAMTTGKLLTFIESMCFCNVGDMSHTWAPISYAIGKSKVIDSARSENVLL